MAPNPISNLFGRSPFRAIQQHMEKAQSGAAELTAFFQAALTDDWTQAEVVQQRIVKLENEADHIKREIRLNLPGSLFLPVPRSDLLELLSIQDRIANEAKDIAGLMLGRHMRVPTSMVAGMVGYLDNSIATTLQARTAINELTDLLEAGFRGRDVDLAEALIRELDRLEHDNDQLQVQIRSQLFAIEDELPPVDVIFLYKIIDWIGDLANHSQKVGSRLQILIAR
jgi:predicted phosphate transport protein (TIGR00153 family)